MKFADLIARFMLVFCATILLLMVLPVRRESFAAQDRAITHNPIRVVGLTAEPHREVNGAFTSCPIEAVVQVVEYLPSGDVRVLEQTIVKIDLIRDAAKKSVMVGGSKRLYSDIAFSLYAAIAQEFLRTKTPELSPDAPEPLPGVEDAKGRKNLREP